MERPIIRYDSSLAEDVMKYLESIRTYKNIKPVSRHIIGPDEELEEFLIFHDVLCICNLCYYYGSEEQKEITFDKIRGQD